MKEKFESIHNQFEVVDESLYKGIQLYLSPLHKANILFIGINPGAGYFNHKKVNVKRLSPLQNFEYIGQKYYLAKQTKKIFKELRMEKDFANAVKINHFPFATRDVKDLTILLKRYDADFKLYYMSREFVINTIDVVKPKLIICEGKSSFDRLKNILNVTTIEYNENIYVMLTNDFVVIGYKRYLSHIKDKCELKSKIIKYYKSCS